MQSTEHLQQPKPLNKLFKWLRVFFIIYIGSEILMVVGSGLMLNSGSEMFGPDQPFTIGDGVAALGGVFLLFSFVVCIALFCIFSYRAIKNITLWNDTNIDTTPAWAVGWYFIPFANLWKPYGAMSDIWYGSVRSDDPLKEVPSTLMVWWICWVISNISSNVSMRMGLKSGLFDDYASNVPLYKGSLQVDILSSVCGIVAAWLILRILKSITGFQNQRIHGDVFS